MLAAQTPGLWQSQLASLAVKMSSDQSQDNCAGPGMDAVTLQKALLQQLQLQNILMLQQSCLNSALIFSSINPLLSLDMSKGQLKTKSQSSSSNLKEEVDDTKMMQVAYSLPALKEDLLKHPLMRENSFYQPPHHGGLPRPPMSVPTPFPPFSPTPPRLQGYQRPQTQVI